MGMHRVACPNPQFNGLMKTVCFFKSMYSNCYSFKSNKENHDEISFWEFLIGATEISFQKSQVFILRIFSENEKSCNFIKNLNNCSYTR